MATTPTPSSQKSTPAISYSTIPKEAAGLFLRLKILVVEDIKDNQAMIQLWLKKTGAKVDVANNGNEGIRLALVNNYDLILMDIQMPFLDGHQTTQSLRRQGFQIPIVALTANRADQERESCFKSGFTDFLEKPIKLVSLIEILRKHLNR